MQNVVERECGNASVGDGGRGGGQSDVMVCVSQVRSEAGAIAQDARQRARNSMQRSACAHREPAREPDAQADGADLRGAGNQSRGGSARLAGRQGGRRARHDLFADLESSYSDASRARPPARPSSDRVVQEEGLQQLAQATRGDVFRIMSNSDFAFQRLALELSGYYSSASSRMPGPQRPARTTSPSSSGAAASTVRSRRQFRSRTRRSGPRSMRSSPRCAIRCPPRRSDQARRLFVPRSEPREAAAA